MELSIYQKNILEYFKNNPHSNMYINAKAGSGKTFIATQMLKDVTERSLYVAFNKSIAEEMKTKITNPKIQINTIHALCYGVLIFNLEEEQKNTIVKNKGTLDNFKIYKIVDELCNKDNSKKYNFDLKEFLKENYIQLYNLVRLKCIDLNASLEELDNELKNLVREHGLFIHEDHKCPFAELTKYIKKIDYLSLKQFDEDKVYDFTDMLYITFKKLQNEDWKLPGWHYYQNIIADECQDLSTIQLYLLKFFKKKTGRYVFCGDVHQAIYAFSGANSYSCTLIKKWFAPIEEFELPINYRCPSSHLDYVNKKFEIGIMARSNAPQGTINTISKEKTIEIIQPGDFLIGRKNKWLMPMIIELVKKGKPVYIKDGSFVDNIKNTIKKQKVSTVLELNRKIKEKETKLKKKVEDAKKANDTSLQSLEENNSQLLDMFNIIKLLIDTYKQSHTNMRIDIFNNYIDKLLNTTYSNDCVFVTTIHCVKGLEAPNCFILNKGEPTISGGPQGFLTKEQRIQEKNLSYVALTRAQEKLYLVKPEGDE